LSSKLGDPGSILGPDLYSSHIGLKIIEEKFYLYIDISKWLDFRVFSDKDVKIAGTSDPYQLGNSLLGNPLTNEWEMQ
jgi:hypothetical protein